MTEQLHRLIDSKAPQEVINERIVAVMEQDRSIMSALSATVDRVGSDHERRVRFLERVLFGALGLIGGISAILQIIQAIKR